MYKTFSHILKFLQRIVSIHKIFRLMNFHFAIHILKNVSHEIIVSTYLQNIIFNKIISQQYLLISICTFWQQES